MTQPKIEYVGIEWYEETWYSRFGTILLTLGVIPVLCFDIGINYWQTYTDIMESSASTHVNYPVPLSSVAKQQQGTSTATATSVQ